MHRYCQKILSKPSVLEQPLRIVFFLKQILRSNSFENILLARLLNLSTNQQLIQHEVGLFIVEDDVQFTNLV